MKFVERNRPHAPVMEWSLSFRDEQRQYADLAAIESHRPTEAAPRVVHAARHRIVRFGRAVQF